jgi:hypothetical protein
MILVILALTSNSKEYLIANLKDVECRFAAWQQVYGKGSGLGKDRLRKPYLCEPLFFLTSRILLDSTRQMLAWICTSH